jgi:hypothetical protein
MGARDAMQKETLGCGDTTICIVQVDGIRTFEDKIPSCCRSICSQAGPSRCRYEEDLVKTKIHQSNTSLDLNCAGFDALNIVPGHALLLSLFCPLLRLCF